MTGAPRPAAAPSAGPREAGPRILRAQGRPRGAPGPPRRRPGSLSPPRPGTRAPRPALMLGRARFGNHAGNLYFYGFSFFPRGLDGGQETQAASPSPCLRDAVPARGSVGAWRGRSRRRVPRARSGGQQG